jgi:hypothetical protein
MPSTHRTLAHRSARRWLAWSLALALPLQGMAAGMLAVAGPEHVHVQTEPALALTDFRRITPLEVSRDQHVLAGLGHFHRHATPLRHRHAAADLSVLLTGNEADPDGPAADDASNTGTSICAFLALGPPAHGGLPPRAAQAPATGALWPATSVDSGRLERPPKAG